MPPGIPVQQFGLHQHQFLLASRVAEIQSHVGHRVNGFNLQIGSAFAAQNIFVGIEGTVPQYDGVAALFFILPAIFVQRQDNPFEHRRLPGRNSICQRRRLQNLFLCLFPGANLDFMRAKR